MKKKRIALVLVPVMALAIGAAYVGTNVANAAQANQQANGSNDTETNDEAPDPTNADGENPND